jgi:hypothetical protein
MLAEILSYIQLTQGTGPTATVASCVCDAVWPDATEGIGQRQTQAAYGPMGLLLRPHPLSSVLFFFLKIMERLDGDIVRNIFFLKKHHCTLFNSRK